MKIDWTKPIQTKDGREARLLCDDLKDCDQNYLVAVLSDDEVAEGLYSFRSNGTRDNTQLAIINVPEEPVKKWVNLFYSKATYKVYVMNDYFFDSEDDALRALQEPANPKKKYIKTIEIEI